MVRDFELQFQNLLREHVDLGVLFVDFLSQLLKLRRLTHGLLGSRRHRLSGNAGRRENEQSRCC